MSHPAGLSSFSGEVAAITFSFLLVIFSANSGRAQEKANAADRSLSLMLPGTWQVSASQKLSLRKDGSIRGSVPLSEGGRQMHLWVTGSWKVLGGRLFLTEEFSTGQKIDIGLEIIGLSETRIILREDKTGEIRSMKRINRIEQIKPE